MESHKTSGLSSVVPNFWLRYEYPKKGEYCPENLFVQSSNAMIKLLISGRVTQPSSERNDASEIHKDFSRRSLTIQGVKYIEGMLASVKLEKFLQEKLSFSPTEERLLYHSYFQELISVVWKCIEISVAQTTPYVKFPNEERQFHLYRHTGDNKIHLKIIHTIPLIYDPVATSEFTGRCVSQVDDIPERLRIGPLGTGIIEYVLTDQGFYPEYMDFSNSILRCICFAKKYSITQKLCELAQVEESLRNLLKTKESQPLFPTQQWQSFIVRIMDLAKFSTRQELSSVNDAKAELLIELLNSNSIKEDIEHNKQPPSLEKEELLINHLLTSVEKAAEEVLEALEKRQSSLSENVSRDLKRRIVNIVIQIKAASSEADVQKLIGSLSELTHKIQGDSASVVGDALYDLTYRADHSSDQLFLFAENQALTDLKMSLSQDQGRSLTNLWNDAKRNHPMIGTQRYLGIGTDTEEDFKKFLKVNLKRNGKSDLDGAELNNLIQSYSQVLSGFLGTSIALSSGLSVQPPPVPGSSSHSANPGGCKLEEVWYRGTDHRIHYKAICNQFTLQDAQGRFIGPLGDATVEFVLTPTGFEVEYITFSNSILRDICFAQQYFVTQSVAQLAQSEQDVRTLLSLKLKQATPGNPFEISPWQSLLVRIMDKAQFKVGGIWLSNEARAIQLTVLVRELEKILKKTGSLPDENCIANMLGSVDRLVTTVERVVMKIDKPGCFSSNVGNRNLCTVQTIIKKNLLENGVSRSQDLIKQLETLENRLEEQLNAMARQYAVSSEITVEHDRLLSVLGDCSQTNIDASEPCIIQFRTAGGNIREIRSTKGKTFLDLKSGKGSRIEPKDVISYSIPLSTPAGDGTVVASGASSVPVKKSPVFMKVWTAPYYWEWSEAQKRDILYKQNEVIISSTDKDSLIRGFKILKAANYDYVEIGQLLRAHRSENRADVIARCLVAARVSGIGNTEKGGVRINGIEVTASLFLQKSLTIAPTTKWQFWQKQKISNDEIDNKLKGYGFQCAIVPIAPGVA